MTQKLSHCHWCKAPYYWLVNTKTKKIAPINATPTIEGNLEIDLDSKIYCVVPKAERVGQLLHTNHWMDCPHQQEVRGHYQLHDHQKRGDQS